MRVLYVSHTAEISGGERSLLGLLGALPASVQPHLAAPAGPLQRAAQGLGVPVTSITGTAGSLRLHPLHTPRAIAEIELAALQVRRAGRRSQAAILHANSIRAGIELGLAPAPRTQDGRPAPRVVHVRDCLPAGVLTSATMRLIAATATTVVANSHYTARSVRAAAPGARVEVVYNAVDLARFDPARIDRRAARAGLDRVPEGALLLGVIAQLSPWKGQDTAIEAVSQLRDDGIDAHLLLIGSAKFVARSTRYDNEAYLRRLHAIAAAAGVADRVSFLGEREDVPELIRALDILLLPSWEEPFGRALIEAMALEVPVIATSVGGPVEILEDGREGLLCPPRDARAWTQAIAGLACDAERRAQMGRAGRERVERSFTIASHVAATLDVYEAALGRRAA
ncbi:MAG TPA: glycosyltransferase family 4 protein [Solirubrobacteraceae bacterium]|jgi:glycosyltransferase involved in cell wall biosynthesis|nr:glycosyltransferase family 4 protein [Solirubrobacteraceae bacterium]